MKKRKTDRKTPLAVRILGYLIALGICVVFSLYMNAPAGWTVFYVLAAAPIFSLTITLITFFTHSIEITSDVSGNMVYKGEDVKLRITVSNKSIFPVPAVRIVLKECGGMKNRNGKENYVVSIQPKGSTVLEADYKAESWGKAALGAKSVFITDFLDLFSLDLHCGTSGHEVKIIPNIPDIPSDTPIIKSAAETIRFSDETEDTKESDKLKLFGGMPGYSHREYTEGDPIRRINWKLSSKKDVYMVRLDDEIEAMQQVIVLDPVGSSRASDERAVEGVLAVVFSLFRLNFESTVWYKTKDGFIPFEISDFGDITALQTAFADYSFSHDYFESTQRIPLSELAAKKQSSGIMLFTPYPDKKLMAEADSAMQSGMAVTVVTSASPMETVLPSPCWLINEDYTAESR